MTNEQIRIAVAEEMGWTNIIFRGLFDPKDKDYAGTHESCRPAGATGRWQGTLPNYPESLDACAEFEATVKDDEWYTYECNLSILSENYTLPSMRALLTATPPQRCKAFLCLRNRWKD